MKKRRNRILLTVSFLLAVAQVDITADTTTTITSTSTTTTRATTSTTSTSTASSSLRLTTTSTATLASSTTTSISSSTTTTRAITATTSTSTTSSLRPTTTTTTTSSTTTTTLAPRFFTMTLPLAVGTPAPCYYVADVSLAANGNSGSFGIEILMNRGWRKLAGGLNFGGAFAADGTRESFAAFNISNPINAAQVVRIDLDAQAMPTAGRDPRNLQLQVQVLDALKRLVAGPFPTYSTGVVGVNKLATEVTLKPGFYSINVKSVSGSPMGTFQLGATTRYEDGEPAEFDGGAVVGGYLTRDGSGKSLGCFVGFCLGEDQEVGVNLYHYDRIGPLVLRVRNSNLAVVFDSQNPVTTTTTTVGTTTTTTTGTTSTTRPPVATTTTTSTTSTTRPTVITTSTSTTTTITTTSTSTSSSTTSSSTTTTTSSVTTTTIPAIPTLTLSGCGGPQGGLLNLPILFQPGVESIKSLRFTLQFDAPTPMEWESIQAGLAANLAHKTVTSTRVTSGVWRVRVEGGADTIGRGVLALLQLKVYPTATLGTTALILTEAQADTERGVALNLETSRIDLLLTAPSELIAVTPASGPPGQLLKLTGYDFGACDSELVIAFRQGSYKQEISDNKILDLNNNAIVVKVPDNAPRGELEISVRVASVGTEKLLFTVTDPLSRPFSAMTAEVDDPAAVVAGLDLRGAAIDRQSNIAYLADNFSGVIRAYDVATRQQIGVFAVPAGRPNRVAIYQEGRQLLVTASGSNINELLLYPIRDKGTLREPIEIGVQGLEPMGVAVNTRTGRAVTANRASNSISLVDLAARSLIAQIPVGREPQTVVVDSDRNLAFALNWADDSVSRINLETREVSRITGTRKPRSANYHRESGTLLVGGENGLLVYRIDRNLTQLLYSGERVDEVVVHATRGLTQLFDYVAKRLTTLDLSILIPDPVGNQMSAVVGRVPLTGSGLGEAAVNPVSNRGVLTHGSGSGLGASEQTGGGGFSRISIPTSLNFPRLSFRPERQEFRVAIANPREEGGTLQMTAINNAGQRVAQSGVRNPAELLLPVRGQRSEMDNGAGLFGDAIRSAGSIWFKLIAPNPGLRAFFLERDGDTSLVGADENGTLLLDAILPAVRPQYRTLISLINPLPVATTVSLDLVSNQGQSLQGRVDRNIPAFGLMQDEVAVLFPNGWPALAAAGGAYLRIRCATALRSYELFVREGGQDPAGLNAQSAVTGSSTLYFSHLVAGRGYATLAGMVNLESSPITVDLTLALDGVSSPAVQSRTIVANGRLEVDIGQLFGLQSGVLNQGWLKIDVRGGQGRLSGYLTCQTASALAAVVSNKEPRTELVFSHIEEMDSGRYTGLALMNPNSTLTRVTIEVYRENGADPGTLVTRKALDLPAGGRMCQTIRQLTNNAVRNQVGGYVVVTSDLPIAGMQIFGSKDDRALANIPAQ